MRRRREAFRQRMMLSAGGTLMIVLLCGVEGTKAFTIEERESQAPLGASILKIGVNSLVGRLLLMRRGSDLCAVRFTKFYRGHDAKPKTWFHSGHENFYAEYEWYWPGTNGDFREPDVETGLETVRQGAIVGLLFLNFGFPLGTDRMKCGSFYSGWFYPTGISFTEGSRYDYDLELAPTQWTELRQIDQGDPKLIWYRLNEDQPNTFIPLHELPSLPNNTANSIEGAE